MSLTWKTIYPVIKCRSSGVFLLIVNTFLLFITFVFPNSIEGNITRSDYIISSVISIPILILFLWIWIASSYKIEDEKLIIRNDPFRWKINIHTIEKIRLDQDTWSSIWKPTLSWKCIQLKYKRLRSVNISPQNQDEFLYDLTSLNSSIEIK